MSTKRTSSEPSSDEHTNDEVFEHGDDVKRAKLTSLSDTTLQDLSLELIEKILFRAIVMEVEEMHLAKSVWKDKADLVISRLSSVCPDWSNILTTNFFQNELYRTLDRTVAKTIRLEILHQSVLDVDLINAVTLKDELFALCQLKGVLVTLDIIQVYDRNNIAAMKDLVDLSKFNPEDMAACNVSNCLYILSTTEEDKIEVVRIAKEDEHQFSISTLIDVRGRWNRLCVAANGSIILWNLVGTKESSNITGLLLLIYDENGSLKLEMKLSSDICAIKEILPKDSGNFVIVSSTDECYFVPQLTEIDMNGTVLRQYQTAYCVFHSVCLAGQQGQIMLVNYWFNEMKLLDNEFNLLKIIVPQLSWVQLEIGSMRFSSSLNYNKETNEIVSVWKGRDSTLCIFHLVEE